MPRLLQVNANGAWKNIQSIRCGPPDSVGDLDNAKTAVVLCRWDRQRGWRGRP